MRNIYILLCLVITLEPTQARTEDARAVDCSQGLIEKVLNYHYAVNAGMQTEGFFDVKGLEELMNDSSIPPQEVRGRIQRHIARLNGRQKKITALQSFYASCGADASKLAIKVGKFEGAEALFLYTFVKGKITNISQESEHHFKGFTFMPLPMKEAELLKPK